MDKRKIWIFVLSLRKKTLSYTETECPFLLTRKAKKFLIRRTNGKKKLSVETDFLKAPNY